MKRTIKYSAFVLLIVLGVAAVLIAFLPFRFSQKISQIERQGFPVRISDLSPGNERVSVTPPADDAIHVLEELERDSAFFSKMWEDADVLSRPVSEEYIARFDAVVNEFPEIYPNIERLVNAPSYSPGQVAHIDDILEDRMADLINIRSCVSALHWKSRVLAAQGKKDEAAQIALYAFKLARLMDNQPTIVCLITNLAGKEIAIEALHGIIAEHELTDRTHELINEVLDAEDWYPLVENGLVTERAVGIEQLRESGPLVTSLHGSSYLNMIQQQIDQVKSRKIATESNVAGGPLVQMSVETINHAKSTFLRVESKRRALRIINTLVKSEISFGDAITESELTKMGVPGDTMFDPVSGDLMRITHEQDRWKVYSVGLNGIDDGGDPITLNDFVLGGKPKVSVSD